MTYTDMWANMDIPGPYKRLARNPYKNLDDMECRYIDALALAIAHWPKDQRCERTEVHTHPMMDGTTEGYYYQYVLGIYSDLHIKEYGCE